MELPVEYTQSFNLAITDLWPATLIAVGQETGRSKQPIVDKPLSIHIPNVATVDCRADPSGACVTVSKLYGGCAVVGDERPPRYPDPGRFAARLFERIRTATDALNTINE